MLKHSDIIQKLNILQKVAIISSALEEEPFVQAGIPPVHKVSLEQLGKTAGVSYGSAVRAWNPELIGKMTEELVLTGAKEGGKLFLTPDLKTAVNPYAEGLSEDPFLNGATGAGILRAIKGAGGASGLYRPTAEEKDIPYLDRNENYSAVHELFVKPFLLAVKDCPCDAAYVDPSREGKRYFSANRAIFNGAQNGLFGDAFIVGNGASSSDAVSLLSERMTLGGCAIPLERAARRYGQLKGYEDEGSIPHREIEDSLRDGSAIDEEKLDLILDGIIDFAIALDRLNIVPYSTEQTGAEAEDPARMTEKEAPWCRQTAAESIVLLKNNGILPLKEGAKIAVLGDAYENTELLKSKYSVTGTAMGYDREKARSESYLPVALRAANEAEAVIVFLTPDATGRELALPPNRIALLDCLKKAGKKVIAAVLGDLPVDMSFDGYVDGLLLAPSDGPFAGDALARVICGEINPSGRLARTSFDRADEYFRALRGDRDDGRVRIGAFTGYRRYGTQGKRVRYPFGFGISYTDFKYSDLAISSEKAEFTLTNCGKYGGYEVAQLYVGMPSVSGVPPKKQLRGFLKVFLKAGESRRISLPLSRATFESYNPRLFSDDVEEGEYTLYIGSSVQKTPLSGKVALAGVKRDHTDERKVDYFPDGFVGDVAEVSQGERIRREADNTPVKIKKAKTAAVYVMPVIALAFFLLVSVLILGYALDYILLSVADEATVEWMLYVIAVAVLALLPLIGSLNRRRLVKIRTLALIVTPLLIVVCFVLGGILLSHNGGIAESIAFRIVTCLAVGVPVCAAVAILIERQLWRTKTGKNRWDKYYFGREREEKTTADSEFEEAFAITEEVRKNKAEEAEEEEETLPAREVVQFYDKQLTYVRLLADLTKFLSERGMRVEEDSLKNYVAAVFSTRLILVPSGSGAALCVGVADYFGKKAYIDNGESYDRYGDLFMQWRQSGNVSCPTNLSEALASARRDGAFLHTVLIRHVKKGVLGALFGPFAEVLSRRRAKLPAAGGKEISLPPNLLIVAEIEDENALDIPAAIAEVAAVISPVCEDCEPAPRKTIMQTVGYERMEAMLKLVRDYYPLDEELWKEVDALDERCRNAHIGNRLWLKLETHSAIISACGGDGNEALDGAVSVELLPWLSAVWGNNSGGDLSGALFEIFGADRLTRTMAIVKGGESE